MSNTANTSAKTKASTWIVSAVLIVILIVLFALSFTIGSSKQNSDSEEGFEGTDSVVTDMMEENGTEPWFHPIWEPASGEIESGLFALQAALGAGIVGYGFGNLRGRWKTQQKQNIEAAATDA